MDLFILFSIMLIYVPRKEINIDFIRHVVQITALKQSQFLIKCRGRNG